MTPLEIATALFVYALCTVAFLPGLALTLAYGGLCGAAPGASLSLAGTTPAATPAATVATTTHIIVSDDPA